jgi:histidyl-tRNA synthetase
MIPRERVLGTARTVYRSYGFAPIDTPALEYAEVLLGKGGEESDKIVYRFQDHGDRDVALRFDLTVPFARFAAAEVPRLGTPFKRYAMGPVWRGENTGQGRYREFWQCDFDTIGTTSNAADTEIALVVLDLLEALQLPDFELRINNRLVLNGLLEALHLRERTVPILRALDKLLKMGRDKVIAEMGEAGVTAAQAEQVLLLAETTGTNTERLDRVEQQFGTNPTVAEGVRRLRELLGVVATARGSAERIRVDLSIARGLDYYTGTIFETFLTGSTLDGKPLSSFGSICSGGRYDNLASLYTKQVLPGVGASLGVDRLLAAMEAMGHPWLAAGRSTPADVLVIQFDATMLGQYQQAAQRLRQAGIGAEVYPEAKKIKPQLEYADRRGFPLALIAGPEEFAAGVWKLKHLQRRDEQTVADDQLVSLARTLLLSTPEDAP